MTGFGRAEVEGEGLRLRVEVRGVNHKGLDVQVSLPASLLAHEPALRSAVKAKVHRGRVEVRVFLEALGEEAVEVRYSEAAARALAAFAQDLQRRGLLSRGMTLSDLLEVPDAVQIRLSPQAEAEAGRILLAALEAALEGFRQTRRAEGEHLSSQFHRALQSLADLRAEAAALAPGQAAQAAERLQQRIAALGASVEPGRLEQEVALIAQRADVTEELVRLEAHIQALGPLLSEEGREQGRRLDHLLQEMQREISTLLAKSDLLPLTQAGLQMRLVVEQMREQAQNVA
ncbi:MAG: YicC/YloC family endoribonuclease [Acidobacteriota bacterium]